jgi:uncharacterized membrane protein YtjA (UPF0391 family)
VAALRVAKALSWPGTPVAQSMLSFSPTRDRMIYWAAVFLVIALVAAFLGFSGIAGVSMNIAWILFIVGLILAVIFFVVGRRPPV